MAEEVLATGVNKMPTAKELRGCQISRAVYRQTLINRMRSAASNSSFVNYKDFDGKTFLSRELVQELEDKGYEVGHHDKVWQWYVKWSIEEDE